jgi:serine/threonine protein kinase
LESCPDCQATIVTLDDTDDSVIGRLRIPPGDESLFSEPQLHGALAAAMAMPAPLPTADMPEMLGEYRVLEELGRGGMGRVYKALHTKLDRVVAVKVLSRGRGGDQQALVRFEREIKAVGRLAHPNIVQAHDAREIDGTPVLIMELVDGLDLAEIVRRTGPAPVAAACELIRQTALALQCAHEHGLVHRDVKPSNIMLARSGEVKLLDLGLARFYAEGAAGVPPAPAGEEMTGTGQAMGTADYMAPEQASDSRKVDIRADLYSLGCTLYKLLSGRAPFSGPEHRGTLDKLNAQVHQQPPFIRRLVPDVPEGLAAIMDRLLAKDPDDRFSTPAEVADALAPWCVGADLPDLLQHAVEARVSLLPPGATTGVVPGGEGSSAVRQSTTAAPLLLTSWGWKWLAGQLLLLLLVGGLGFVLGIMIRIHKDGRETTAEVPAGSKTRISADGQLDVTLPGQTKAAEPSRMTPAGPEVKERLNAAEDEVDKLLATLQGAAGDPGRLMPPLINLAHQRPRTTHPAVARALEAILLDSRDENVRGWTCRALANWGTPESVAALKRVAKSDIPALSQVASNAIAEISTRRPSSSTAVSAIGIKFGLGGAKVAGSVAGPAGVVAMANWNNFSGDAQSTPQPLINGGGNRSGATVIWNSPAIAWATYGDNQADQNAQLLNTFLGNWRTSETVTISGIPFSSYNVYVYFTDNHAGHLGNVAIRETTYYFQTLGPITTRPYPLMQTTATTYDPSGASYPLANCALFTGLSGSSVTITESAESGGSGLAAVEVVSRDKLPGPSSAAPAVHGPGELGHAGEHRRTEEDGQERHRPVRQEAGHAIGEVISTPQ